MSVDLPISLSPRDMHREAIDDVNRWRGHCTDLFARIDAAVAETLEVLAETGAPVKTPHLFGQRMPAMRDALASDLPFAVKSGPILKMFDALGPHLARRNIIIHATGSVWINPGGAWLWRYCVTPSGKNRSQEQGSIDRCEALAIEKELAPMCRSFCDQLSNLRRR